MPILKFRIEFPGQANGLEPRFGHMLSNDTLAVVSSAGYMNSYLSANALAIYPNDFIFVAAADGHQIYKPVFTGTSIQLTVLP